MPNHEDEMVPPSSESEQTPLTAAERISKALRRRKKRNRVRRVAGKCLGIALIATLLILAVVLIYRNWDFFQPDSFRESVTVQSNSKSLMKIGGAIDIVTGNTAQYLPFASGLAVITTTNVRYATETGEEGFLADVTLTRPSAVTAEDGLVVYDRGGTTVISASKTGILAEAEAVGNCISAAINDSGSIAVVSECEGYLSAVAVYDRQLNRRYLWKTPEYFVANACVSENGKWLAVSVVTTESYRLISKVLIFDLRKEGVAAEVNLGDVPVVGLLENDAGLLVVTETDAVTMDWGGTVRTSVSFGGDRVCGLEWDEKTAFVLLSAQNDATVRYRLVHLDASGAQNAAITLTCDIQAISVGNGMLALLSGSQIRMYDRELSIQKYISPEPGVTNIVTMRDNKLVMITAQELFVA